jgi:hypothetical protein
LTLATPEPGTCGPGCEGLHCPRCVCLALPPLPQNALEQGRCVVIPPRQSRSQELTIPAPPHQGAPPSLAANWRPLAIRLAAAVKAIYERDEDGVSAPGHLEALRLSEQLERMALDSDEGPR